MKRPACLLALLCLFLFSACKKEVETDAYLISKKLQEVIKAENVVRVVPVPDWIPGGGTITYFPDYGKTYQFDPPFFIISSYSYNLATMKRYYLSDIDSEKTLFLVF